MKLPSLQRVVAAAGRVARRFPLTLLSSAVLCAVMIYEQQRIVPQQTQGSSPNWLYPLFTAAGLALPLTLLVSLAAERYRWATTRRWLTQAGALAAVATWYALCPPEPGSVWILRTGLVALGLHLLVAAGPFLPELGRGADSRGFWRYNEILFLRILTAGLYSGVLYAGCALALLAVDNLFGVEVSGNVYGHLLAVLFTVFNTWFFLAGVPDDFAALEREVPYPKGLQLFTQFVLLPLVVLYLGILYAYLGRIVVLWELPQGWVSTLVLALAVAGIFALLLIHPIREAAENTWIRTFARWFYRALFPLLGLLAVAIGTRIRDYGITEQRYLVLALALWLAGMATYFLLRRGRGIVWIPVTLAGVAFVAAGGPWGAFAVAERSQLAQLREISQQYKLLSKEGKLDEAGRRVPGLPKTAAQRLTSIFEFFAERDALATLQPYFAANVAVVPDSIKRQRWQRSQWQQERLFQVAKLPRTAPYHTDEDLDRMRAVSFRATNQDVTPLASGMYLLNNFHIYSLPDSGKTYTLPQATVRVRPSARGDSLHLLQRSPGSRWQPVLTLSVAALADSLARQYGPSLPNHSQQDVRPLLLQAETPQLRLRVALDYVRREQKRNAPITYHYGGKLILTFTSPASSAR